MSFANQKIVDTINIINLRSEAEYIEIKHNKYSQKSS